MPGILCWIVAALLSTAVGCRPGGSDATDPKVVELRAEDGVFVADGVENPTLRVAADRRLVLQFENTDPGIHHAISVPQLTSTRREVESGDRAQLVVEADQPGVYRYVCDHHRPLMEGELVVTSPGSDRAVATHDSEPSTPSHTPSDR